MGGKRILGRDRLTERQHRDGASSVRLPARVADAFGVTSEVIALPGTESRTFRSGDVVLRQGQSESALLWTMTVLDGLPAQGFRVERPLRARDGSWIVDGWTAWTFLEGRSATPADASAIAVAVQALHDTLVPVPYARHLTEEAGFADRAAWGDEAIPSQLPSQLDLPLRKLAAMRRPVAGLHNQVIHGDLNYHNILVSPGQDPGFIDFSPYWRPPDFAAAIAAYWLGPYHGQTAILYHFRHVRELEQMLVRVALRQLLRLIQMDALEWADEFAQAAENVYQLIR
jgi:uncharacterized protein (TIGR02569 family)